MDDNKKSARLVRTSRWVALGAVTLMLGGCAVSRQTHTIGPIQAGAVVGIMLLVAAAVIGQIGRAMQGRVI